jgi:hypothetical protein
MEEVSRIFTTFNLRRLCAHPQNQVQALQEIASKHYDKNRAHLMARMLLECDTSEPSREDIWDQVRRVFLPKCVAPRSRLTQLLNQALLYQYSHCMYHNPLAGYSSLFQDHHCSVEGLPLKESMRLEGHMDEVWYISLNNSGDLLASASKDTSICVWDMQSTIPIAVLKGHTDACSFLAWSPDDRYLTSASNDQSAIIWDTQSWQRHQTLSTHTEAVSAIVWLSPVRLFTASCDHTIKLWNSLNGESIETWAFPGRVQDINLSSDRNSLIVACSDRNVQIIDITHKSTWFNEPVLLPERFPVNSISAARLSNHVLVNVSKLPPCIHLWDLSNRKIVQKYSGHKQGRFIIRSNFGGEHEQFVISGSEDGCYHIWNRFYGSLLATVNAHPIVVNAVVWSPIRPELLATCSDDRTIRIWRANL